MQHLHIITNTAKAILNPSLSNKAPSEITDIASLKTNLHLVFRVKMWFWSYKW